MLIFIDETQYSDENDEDVLIIKKSKQLNKLKGPENFRVCHNEDEFYKALDTNKEEFNNYLGQVKRLFNDTERNN